MRLRVILLAGIAAVLAIAAWAMVRSWSFSQRTQAAPAAGAVASPSVAAADVGPFRTGVPSPAPLAGIGTGTPMSVASSHAPAGQASASPTDTPAPKAEGPMDRATAMGELFKVHQMIGSYHTLMGENPVGTNAEIMKALMGRNPRGAMLGPPPGQGLDGSGQLLDPWGTPYFFHQLSGNDMEIHSAGPDKIMGTADDLVIH